MDWRDADGVVPARGNSPFDAISVRVAIGGFRPRINPVSRYRGNRQKGWAGFDIVVCLGGYRWRPEAEFEEAGRVVCDLLELGDRHGLSDVRG